MTEALDQNAVAAIPYEAVPLLSWRADARSRRSRCTGSAPQRSRGSSPTPLRQPQRIGGQLEVPREQDVVDQLDRPARPARPDMGNRARSYRTPHGHERSHPHRRRPAGFVIGAHRVLRASSTGTGRSAGPTIDRGDTVSGRPRPAPACLSTAIPARALRSCRRLPEFRRLRAAGCAWTDRRRARRSSSGGAAHASSPAR